MDTLSMIHPGAGRVELAQTDLLFSSVVRAACANASNTVRLEKTRHIKVVSELLNSGSPGHSCCLVNCRQYDMSFK